MGTTKRIPAEVREQILNRIRTEGVSATQAAKEHGIHPVTVYTWLKRSTVMPSSILQINKLKRENEELKKLLGQAMLMNERSKKNQPHYGI
jgi:transposase-like protein